MAKIDLQPQPDSRPNRRVLIALVAGLAAISLCLCVVGAAGGLIYLFADTAATGDESYPVLAAVDAPTRVPVGEPFTIEIVIENPTLAPHELHSIDIDLSYLEGIEIVGSVPAFSRTFRLTPLLPQRTFSYGRHIPAGETVVIELQAAANVAGDYGGNLDVCINSGGNCRPFSLETQIE